MTRQFLADPWVVGGNCQNPSGTPTHCPGADELGQQPVEHRWGWVVKYTDPGVGWGGGWAWHHLSEGRPPPHLSNP